MSRVYEALRQSEVERGVSTTFLDPDSLLSGVAPVRQPVPEPEALVWEEIVPFKPVVRTESRLVAFDDDNGLGAEKFRLLRARLRNLQEPRVRRVVVTSAVPEEGKTLVSMNLAVSLSKHTTDKVLLLEGDLRKPMLAEHFGIAAVRGLDDWFASNEPVSRFLYRVEGLQLWILPAGVANPNPLAILQSPRFSDLYRQLSQGFDWILIDAPPLLPMADVNFWSRQADGLLLVVREGKAARKALQKGLETLDNPTVLGVVFNGATNPERHYYESYYAKGTART
jgi:capsular exopolysaccharide synthesis family protein